MLNPAANGGKVQLLDQLHVKYVKYLRLCVDLMVERRAPNMPKSAKQAFFPKATELTSQIEKNARDHAISIVSGWFASRYTNCMKAVIRRLKREESFGLDQAKRLQRVGKYRVNQARVNGSVSQDDIDLYWQLLEAFGGRKPTVRDNAPMWLSENTAPFEDPEEKAQRGKKPSKPKAKLADHWLHLSTLTPYKKVWLPLVGTPYVQSVDEVGKGLLARKTAKGSWRFEAVERKEYPIPELPDDAPRLGVDVGLNVLVATSDGDLYGKGFKPKFDKTYKAVKDLRANRQRQGLKENSPRLGCLESKLSGMIKTETGRISNALVKKHPGTIFVLEDLDLRGCRGQKRFAYRAFQRCHSAKASTEAENPAYTSQECPSCGYISRSNRSGTKFHCRSCGRKAHADWVGASGILRRSWDTDIGCGDHPSSVKTTLRRRFRARRARTSPARSSGFATGPAPPPLGRSLTTEVPGYPGIGTGSNAGSHEAS